jgi:hypothetical protein
LRIRTAISPAPHPYAPSANGWDGVATASRTLRIFVEFNSLIDVGLANLP